MPSGSECTDAAGLVTDKVSLPELLGKYESMCVDLWMRFSE